MTIEVVVKNYGHPVKVTTTEGGIQTIDNLDVDQVEERTYVAFQGRSILVEEIVPGVSQAAP